MKDYDYTYKKFTQAIECLIIGEWDIRSRLKDAYVFYLSILAHIDNFPNFLKRDWQFIENQMTKFQANGDMKYLSGVDKNWEYVFKWSIDVTMNKIKRKTWKKIAERIFYIREQLHKIKYWSVY
jgi:hypothetical protein